MNTERIFTKQGMALMPALFALLAMLALPAAQAQAQEMAHHHQETAVAPPAGAMSTGEVTKVDKETGKITLRHGPLANLGMPGMTMAFKVADPAMLEQVKPGDRVQFVAERVNGALAVTTLKADN